MSTFESTLIRRIRSYAGQLTSLVKSYAPRHLQKGIKTSVDEKRDGSYRITIHAQGADVHAQEYGSGIHDKKNPHKYPIVPKNKKFLAFNWEVADANPDKFSFLPDGRVLLPSVQHPGIEKYQERGYIAPAVKDFRRNIKSKDFSAELKRAILADIKKSFEAGKNG